MTDDVPTPLDRLGGLAEVSLLVGRNRSTVSSWHVNHRAGFPQPVHIVAATPLWDMRVVAYWAMSHPDIADTVSVREWLRIRLEKEMNALTAENGDGH